MENRRTTAGFDLVIGLLAGLAGTVAMSAMRNFDQRYAPKTAPAASNSKSEALLRAGCSALAGVLYAKLRGPARSSSALRDGGLIGIALYFADEVFVLPLLHLARPLWRQAFPQLAGEALRHIACGVTTAAVYRALDGHPMKRPIQ